MSIKLGSVCINHPGVEAASHCRTCGKPVCHACTVAGPTGKFCSFECRERHEKFVKDAQDTDIRAGRGSFNISFMIRKLIGSAIVLILVCIAVGVVASMVPIPILSNLTYMVRNAIGI